MNELSTQLPREDEIETDDEVDLWPREESPVVHIPITDSINLHLNQLTSEDDRWGIYSTVWDGGVGTLAYFRKQLQRQTIYHSNNDHEKASTLIVDLGSGTGIVGIGMALLGYSSILTDLPVALPLLEENIQSNQDAKSRCQAMGLIWGGASNDTKKELPLHLKNKLIEASRVIVVGAEIVYRKNLFEPLLETLTMLLKCRLDATCIIGSWSGRTYFDDFCEMAESSHWGFQVILLASVVIEDDKGAQLDVQDAEVGCNSFRDTGKGPRTVNVFQFVLQSQSS